MIASAFFIYILPQYGIIKEKGGFPMDNTQLLQQLAESSRKQERFARIQCIFTIVSAAACLLLLFSISRVIPQVMTLAAQISGISTQAETVLTNLETVTEELAQADISSMVSNADSLAQTSQTGIRQALEKINAIDIEGLNKAIENLSKIVSPLADLVQKLDSLSFLK